jgi:metal-responsive CopG/Arc/MetJ family transcriptional regulator
MVNTGISVPEDLLEEFDDKIFELKAAGKLPRDASRSEVIRTLMSEWVDQDVEAFDEGNSSRTTAEPMAAD